MRLVYIIAAGFLCCGFVGAGAPIDPNPAVTCNVVTTVPAGLNPGVGSCSGAGAVCNNVADAGPAFTAFSTWAQAWEASNPGLTVGLFIPSGSICKFAAGNENWVGAIKNLVVTGYGAELNGSFFLSGPNPVQYPNNLNSTRLQTVTAGSTTVVVNPSSASQPAACSTVATCVGLFTVGHWALITGYDMQGNWNAPGGQPTNNHFFEYVKVTGKNTTTGEITLFSPLKSTYKSTWPNFNSGNGSEPDAGGPATLYRINQVWDQTLEYRGLTINRGGSQTYGPARSITFRDVKWIGGSFCFTPTMSLLARFINNNMSACTNPEPDKYLETLMYVGTTISNIDIQSSSNNWLILDNSRITTLLVGSPKNSYAVDTSIADFRPGAFAFGRSDSFKCVNCIIPTFAFGGILDKGCAGAGSTEIGVNNAWTMLAGGVIRINNTYQENSLCQPARWAVPGTNIFWSSGTNPYNATGGAFQVVDVTQDATYFYVQLSDASISAWPTASAILESGTGKLFIKVHPAPIFNCVNCTGSTFTNTASHAPVDRPIFSNLKSSASVQPSVQGGGIAAWQSWGKLNRLTVTVNPAFSGTPTPYTLNVLNQFATATIKPSDSTLQNYTPVINMRQAGVRVITPGSVTCDGVVGAGTGCSGDTGLALAEANMFVLTTSAFNNQNLSTGTPPTISIDMVLDQGVVTCTASGTC